MLILAATTDALEVVLGAAPVAQLPVVVSWRDIDTTNYTAGRTVLLTNGVTPVAAAASPAASVQRVIDFLSVFNPNAANATISISYNLNGTRFVLTSVTLAQNERLQYQDSLGWTVYTSSGAAKQSLNQGSNSVSSGDSVVVLAADVVNANATANTIADVTGLSFPVVAGQRYAFEFLIRYAPAATTTGARFSISGPTFDELTYDSEYSLTLAGRTINTSLGAYDQPAASNASSGATTGNLALITGFVRTTAAGSIICRFASEVLSSAITAKAGSFVRYRAL